MKVKGVYGLAAAGGQGPQSGSLSNSTSVRRGNYTSLDEILASGEYHLTAFKT